MEEKNNGREELLSSEGTEKLMETGAVCLDGGAQGKKIYCLPIIGQIEGHCILPELQKSTKYEHVIPLLAAIEEDDKIGGLLMILNTVGGDVEAGLAIAELVSSMKKPTVSLVIGGGHSIGVPLAVAAKRSFIAKSATMTVHPVRMNGLVIAVPQTFRYFSKMQDRIISFVEEHSNISAKRLRELMMNSDDIATDIGTILDGEEAVREGLIDEVGGLTEALFAVRELEKGKL